MSVTDVETGASTGTASSASKAGLPLVTAAALFLAAFCDLGTYIRSSGGGLSGSAVASAIVAAIGVVSLCAFASAPRSRLRPLAPLILFALWSLFGLVFLAPSIAGAQSVVIYIMFVTVALLTASFVQVGEVQRAVRALAWVGLAIAGLYGYNVATGGVGADGLIGRRSFALEALILMGFFVPRGGRTRLERWLPTILFVLICLSLSRTALVVGAMLLAVQLAYAGNRVRVRRLLVLFGVAVAALFYAIQRIPTLKDRFEGGDQAFQIGGHTISTQGRSVLWRIVWDGIQTSPWIGHGPGSVTYLISQSARGETQPHNDFLRAFYDSGLVGLLLLVIGIVTLLVATAGRASQAATRDARSIHAGAFLAVLAFTFGSLTDNAIIYSFVMAPLAVIIGLSLSDVVIGQPAPQDLAPRPGEDQTPVAGS